MNHSLHKDLFERRHAEGSRNGEARDPFEHDRSRIIHSSFFRRLQGKTQVMGAGNGEGDMHRTRLTHSLEVSQVATGLRGLLAQGGLTQDVVDALPHPVLIESAALCHDVGHPPFGHSGEEALQACMLHHGGFEGNAQNYRILDKLECTYGDFAGINPTRGLVLSVMKYPVPYSAYDLSGHAVHPPKCYYDGDADLMEWALRPFHEQDRVMFSALSDGTQAQGQGQRMPHPVHRTFHSSILEHADDIAYGVHDLEDAVACGMVTRDAVAPYLSRPEHGDLRLPGKDGDCVSLSVVVDNLFRDARGRKQAVGSLVHYLMTSVTVHELPQFRHALLRHRAVMSPEAASLLCALKECVQDLVIRQARARQASRKGKMVVSRLFSEFMDAPSLLPREYGERYEALASDGSCDATGERVVCDYIAGMTDGYAERAYNRLFTPGRGGGRE